MKQIVLTALAASLLLVGVTVSAQTCDSNTPDDAPTSRYKLNADGTTRDLRTGLMWMRCAMGQTWDAANKTCKGKATRYTWKEALQAARDLNQKGGFAGYTDWRVPNARELTSIERYHCSNPAINLEVFPNTPPVTFWSSTPLGGFFAMVWTLDFGTSHLVQNGMRNEFALRLVRSGAWPNELPTPSTSSSAANVVH